MTGSAGAHDSDTTIKAELELSQKSDSFCLFTHIFVLINVAFIKNVLKMVDHEQKGMELMAQAEKKTKSSGGFFGMFG